MTEEQKKKIGKKINILSMGALVVLIVFLIVCAVTGRADSVIFPAGIGFFLALHWFLADVLPVIWQKIFEGKTQEQVKAYYIYAAMELIGFAGLTYFMIDMRSTTGALIYVFCLFMKKRFLDQFKGIVQEEPEDEEEEEEIPEIEEEVQEEVIELQIPEVRATEEDLIAQAQAADDKL